MGRNFDDYPVYQPKRSWANTYAQDCMYISFKIQLLLKSNFACIVCAQLHVIYEVKRKIKQSLYINSRKVKYKMRFDFNHNFF